MSDLTKVTHFVRGIAGVSLDLFLPDLTVWRKSWMASYNVGCQ